MAASFPRLINRVTQSYMTEKRMNERHEGREPYIVQALIQKMLSCPEDEDADKRLQKIIEDAKGNHPDAWRGLLKTVLDALMDELNGRGPAEAASSRDVVSLHTISEKELINLILDLHPILNQETGGEEDDLSSQEQTIKVQVEKNAQEQFDVFSGLPDGEVEEGIQAIRNFILTCSMDVESKYLPGKGRKVMKFLYQWFIGRAHQELKSLKEPVGSNKNRLQGELGDLMESAVLCEAPSLRKVLALHRLYGELEGVYMGARLFMGTQQPLQKDLDELHTHIRVFLEQLGKSDVERETISHKASELGKIVKDAIERYAKEQESTPAGCFPAFISVALEEVRLDLRRALRMYGEIENNDKLEVVQKQSQHKANDRHAAQLCALAEVFREALRRWEAKQGAVKRKRK